MRQLIRRLGLGAGLGISLAIVWSQVFVVSAAPMPKVGVADQTSGGAGIANATYTVVADMVVAAGKYHVTARGTVNHQTGAPVDWVSCNAYGGSNAVDTGTTSAPLQYAAFAIDGTVDLPAGGTIRVECLSSVGAGTLPFVGVSLVAESVAGISLLP
jgi:hypothetical protein